MPGRAGGRRRVIERQTTRIDKGRLDNAAEPPLSSGGFATRAAPGSVGICEARKVEKPLSQTELNLRPLEVIVDGDNVERAIKILKRQVAHEGVYKELKRRRFYEKPSVKRKRKQREAERRRRKERRRAMRARNRRQG